MEEALVLLIIFGTIFGLGYLHYSTRHKERLALIEKGVDASIFVRGKREEHAAPVWKILILNIALLLMGVGIGIFIASILHYNLGVEEEVAYPGTIFLMAGIGLFTGFKLTLNLEDKEKNKV
jgi:multisubunit Na+/H+ antiporter MnhC subunit